MAQWLSWLERRPVTAEVESSSLFWVVCGVLAQLVEHMPYKHGVTGSSPVVPTIFKLPGAVVQLVRTPACHAGGRGFKSLPSRQYSRVSRLYASVAQLVEQRTENPRVVGSIPTGGTKVLTGFPVRQSMRV